MVLIRTLLVLLVIAASATAASAAEAWRIVASTGAVKAGGPGVVPVAVNAQQTLPADSWVETGATGRAVIARGLESIAVAPNSRVLLPSQPVNGNTQVLQTLGSAFYQIGKQKTPHFQVDTPYLAAVVKGTTFLVRVSEGAASVDVTEGLVQVATPDGAHSAFVQPGFSAIVSRAQRDGVQVVPTSEAPAQTPASNGDAGTTKESSNGTGRVVILAAIGEVSLDVQAASGGLVSLVEPPTAGTTKEAKTKDGLSATVGDAVATLTDASESSASAGAAAGSVVSIEASGGVAGAPAGGVSAGVGVGTGIGGLGAEAGLGGANGNGGGGGGIGLGVGVGNGGAGVDVGLGSGGGSGGLGLGVNLGGGK